MPQSTIPSPSQSWSMQGVWVDYQFVSSLVMSGPYRKMQKFIMYLLENRGFHLPVPNVQSHLLLLRNYQFQPTVARTNRSSRHIISVRYRILLCLVDQCTHIGYRATIWLVLFVSVIFPSYEGLFLFELSRMKWAPNENEANWFRLHYVTQRFVSLLTFMRE